MRNYRIEIKVDNKKEHWLIFYQKVEINIVSRMLKFLNYNMTISKILL